MRLIGHLPNQTSAIRFSSYLYGTGIANIVESEETGYAIWVYSEDSLATAQRHYQKFLGNPQDPVFQPTTVLKPSVSESPSPQPAGSPEETIDEIKAFVKANRRYGLGPLSLALVIGCVLVSFLSEFGANQDFLAPLYLTGFQIDGDFVKWQTGLPEVAAGQWWRLITPVLIHSGFFQMFFGALWILGLGSMVEARQSTKRLLALVLMFGIMSNLGQYFLLSPCFGGISGVAYGLLGYVWMKNRFEPRQGLILNLNTAILMMIWFFLCFLDIVPNAPNGAHMMGFLSGVVVGYISTRPGLAPAGSTCF